MTEVAYHRGDGADARHHVEDLVVLYGTVFADPPYHEGPAHVRQFRRWLTSELDNPGFTLIRAIDADQLVGMAYGYTMAAGDWWHDATTDPPEGLRAAAKFAVLEWAVRPDRQGAGIGHRLMTELLAGRTEPYATLNANPAALAYAIYVRWGWKPIGQTRPKIIPPMEAFVLPLNPATVL